MKFRNTIPKWSKLLALWLLLAWLLPTESIAQNRKSLERKRKALLTEIATTSNLLSETTRSKNSALNRYVALKKQIENREALLQTLQEEVELTNQQIERTNDVVHGLKSDLVKLKEEYAVMLRTAYRQKVNRSAWYLLFSARDFNDAFLRWRYLKQYNNFRKKQAQLILDTQKTLETKIAALEARSEEKEILLTEQAAQKERLIAAFADRSRLLDDLKADESRLRKELRIQQSAHEQMNVAIEKVIRKEVITSRKKARSRESLNKRTNITPSPNVAKLSRSFNANKGKLPWPVQNGIITGYFGKQPHPTLRRVEITNNGIDIRTQRNAEVRSVFTGVVVGRQFVPGYNHMLIIRHGDYYTVYSNLKEVFVKKNEKVTINQRIGTVSVDKKKNVAEVHFEVWRDKVRLNPVKWIARQ